MFFDDSLKGLKKELKTVGADVSFVKNWQKSYDKVKKQSPGIEEQYIKTKAELETVMGILKGMEQFLISMKDGMDLADVQAKLLDFAKDLKRYQNDFNYEFLISKEDKEFHLTYEAIITLCGKHMGNRSDLLILQSEVENLMAIAKEALTKEWPDSKEMAYYYLEHTDREIFELPHQDKVQVVKNMYESEFYSPMKEVIEDALGAERATEIMEVELWI